MGFQLGIIVSMYFKFGAKTPHFINILRYCLLMLSIAPSCFMEKDFKESKSFSSPRPSSSSVVGSESSLPWSLVGGGGFPVPVAQDAIEMVGPRDFQALSGNLVLWTRLSPLVFNLTGTLDLKQSFRLSSIAMQLFFCSEEGGESKKILLTTQPVPLPITTSWEKVSFPCNVIVQGGLYLARLIHISSPEGESDSRSSEEEIDFNNPTLSSNDNVQILSNITINIRYPTIVFEVPHRIDAYTTSTPITFGFTKSTGCEPKRPLPPTILVLSICSPEEVKTELESDEDMKKNDGQEEADSKDCNRDFAPVFQNPLHSLQKEGRVTMSVECHLWARNATYRVQLREKSTRAVIAKSRPIRVEWGSQFSINMSKPTVMPCRGSIRAIVSYPSCVLPGKDKIRVYGHETLSVPSALVPSRLSYIAEHKIQPSSRVVTFRCNLFPQRFLRFCFQYINTAVDDSVAIVMEKCIPTNPPLQLVDGGWGEWSPWTPCTVTCGQDGRQYRYRFCDNPPPSSGANFCRGESIEEQACDSGTIPTCPPILFYVDSSGGESGTSLDPYSSSSGEGSTEFGSSSEQNHPTHTHPHSQHRHSLHQLQLENITLTPGCECGCILYDLIPERNDTLVIFISSNYSSPCADEDEFDHHKFKWIFHAKDERNRVRLEVVEMEVQCVTITFRDGNTTDSNLLQVITSEEQQSHYEELLSQPGRPWDDSNKGGGSSLDVEDVFEPLTLESTGASLSISAFDTNKNCSGQFIYFIAYYSTLTSTNSSLALIDSAGIPEQISHEMQLVLKLILLFFVLVIILSGFGGCVTKAYRKKKYKELKCFDNEDESGAFSDGTSIPEGGRNGGGDDDTSRCTSVTLMSFDYSYWRRIRLLRLKYFLLRPRPLNYISSKVKSFPSTPTHGRSRLVTKARLERGTLAAPTGSTGSREPSPKNPSNNPNITGGDKSHQRLSKSISLSETNLRVEKVDGDLNASGGTKGGKNKKKAVVVVVGEDEGRGADVAKSWRMTRTIYSKDPLSIETSMSNSLNGHSIRTPKPYDPRSQIQHQVRETGNENEKLLKEKENLKRRGKKDKRVDETEEKLCSSNLTNKKELEKLRRLVGSGSGERVELMMTGLHRKRDIGKSQLSLATTTHSSLRLCGSSCGEEDSSRTELDDADQDFEMDYYDYDVMNAGNIPGSYLSMEPAFVLWNSEVYHDQEGGNEEVEEGEDAKFLQKDPSPIIMDEDEHEHEHQHLIIPMSRSNASNNTSSSRDEGDIEMTTTTASTSTSLGIFSVSDPLCMSQSKNRCKKQIQATMRETSLDTLKFADEDDDTDIEDDNATQGSDSIFDNEQDLISDDQQSHNQNSSWR